MQYFLANSATTEAQARWENPPLSGATRAGHELQDWHAENAGTAPQGGGRAGTPLRHPADFTMPCSAAARCRCRCSRNVSTDGLPIGRSESYLLGNLSGLSVKSSLSTRLVEIVRHLLREHAPDPALAGIGSAERVWGDRHAFGVGPLHEVRVSPTMSLVGPEALDDALPRLDLAAVLKPSSSPSSSTTGTPILILRKLARA